MRKYIWLSLAAILVTGLSVGYIIIRNTPKPDLIIVEARNWHSEAHKFEAMIYAPKDYKLAKTTYDSAMRLWSKENQKMMVQRNYKKVIDYAQASISHSRTAISSAKSVNTQLNESIAKQIKIVEAAIKTYEKNFTKLPTKKSRVTDFSKSQLLYNQALIARKNGKLFDAQAKIDSAAEMIKRVNDDVTAQLKEYFSNQNNWSELAQDCIHESSKRKTTSLLIDKYARKCYVYKNGRLIDQFDVELGANWLGDKQQEGDKRTPEGSYTVTKKHDHKKSKYYKALVLNFPNEADKKQFEANKLKGIVPAGKRIGGLIEIHGDGGRGADWTEGCVALHNKDMDKIYNACQIGTNVVIVGSIENLNDILND